MFAFYYNINEIHLSIPVTFNYKAYYTYDTSPICLYKHGFIDLSLILQAVKCQAASSARKAVANPTLT